MKDYLALSGAPFISGLGFRKFCGESDFQHMTQVSVLLATSLAPTDPVQISFSRNISLILRIDSFSIFLPLLR